MVMGRDFERGTLLNIIVRPRCRVRLSMRYTTTPACLVLIMALRLQMRLEVCNKAMGSTLNDLPLKEASDSQGRGRVLAVVVALKVGCTLAPSTSASRGNRAIGFEVTRVQSKWSRRGTFKNYKGKECEEVHEFVAASLCRRQFYPWKSA